MLHPSDFFDLSDTFTAGFFAGCEFVWQALAYLEERLLVLLKGEQVILGQVLPGAYLGDRPVYIAEGARIEPGAYVLGPAYIGPGVSVRHGAYLRENVVMLAGSALGHASEAKHSLFLPQAHAPHFNYVGDSILGHRVNLGAGTKLSNLTLVSEKDPLTGQRPTIKLHVNETEYDTGLIKLGAILGDDAQTGCNSVLNPGCLVGRNTLVYANLSLRKGYFPPDTVLKLRQTTREAPRQK
ncbi:MAG: glucose-1-phosphate thymidylyltransferase [Chloroflexi bacterium]|nr:glucose-1-phosphate thymidylyltransferase [Chloroflexota bacterium]MCI0580708.1 glucose-1-phosphate thymidylyltransferase [Chloroflexota bacterium]MCI0648561.1 glucose-1-phosphate thymidylyltransferase [Chloroflexota bacterium]MCI0727324.1 glucose-1-phosphate thymidylyltransferase [Chloroflexota bacterium]